MLVGRYETKGAVIEIFNDDYTDKEKEELERRRQHFLRTAQMLLCHNSKNDKTDP